MVAKFEVNNNWKTLAASLIFLCATEISLEINEPPFFFLPFQRDNKIMLNSKYCHISLANRNLNLDLYIFAAKGNEQKYPQGNSAERIRDFGVVAGWRRQQHDG